jgi:radical SAM superfamily enzyme YgiQ (UPF0313 family)
MVKKILLIQPSNNMGKTIPETPSRALLILGTLAKQRGHEVKIVHEDLWVNTNEPYSTPIDNILNTIKPDIVGITCNTFQVKNARHIAHLSHAYGAKVIVGGPHAPAWDGEADKVVIGEGENSFLEFIGEAPSIKTIDDIPIPDYSLVDLSKFCGISPVGMLPSLAIMASRGCPYHCSFCNTPIFWGSKIRYRNPQSVVDEVELLHKTYGVNEIFFQDDTFNLNHEWAFAIFNDIIARGLNNEMLFKIDCRVNEKLLTKEFLDLAFKAGVWNIFYGIESGSQPMLDRMHKGITVDEIKRAVRMTNEAKIQSQCSFIVGMPGESLATLNETRELLKEINPTRYGWSHGCPFPGTEFDKEVTEKKHKREIDYNEYGYGKIMVRTDALDFNELEAFRGF